MNLRRLIIIFDILHRKKTSFASPSPPNELNSNMNMQHPSTVLRTFPAEQNESNGISREIKKKPDVNVSKLDTNL